MFIEFDSELVNTHVITRVSLAIGEVEGNLEYTIRIYFVGQKDYLYEVFDTYEERASRYIEIQNMINGEPYETRRNR